MSNPSLTLGVLIRFANSAETLPDVLAALKKQTLQPDVILGVDNGSGDGSRQMIEAAGGLVIEWSERYEHSKVLNFGIRPLKTDLVLILSSHTVLEAPDTIERMIDAMSEPQTVCVSGKWDADSYYSDAIDWKELRAKGLKFGSLYSNSMGMIRRSAWELVPFDETTLTSEDYAWVVEQLYRGHVCKRLDFPFGYRRSGCNRDEEFAVFTFSLARKYQLHVTWLGPVASVRLWLQNLAIFGDECRGSARRTMAARMRAWLRVQFFQGHVG